MSQPSREQYLESKVFTASQPQLHMMLLDGALRFGNQAKEIWAEKSDFSLVEQPLTRMFDIVEELLQGLACGEGEISAQLAEQYAFVYRELAVCRINENLDLLDGCMDILSFQRETWNLASEQMESEQAAPKVAQSKPTMPHMPLMDSGNTTQVSAGFSLEA
ncbi:MAG: flagellar protein FliS [Planctomycetes bacterium]|nr:flagellar protein FliS [Planctomycetota bacterium]